LLQEIQLKQQALDAFRETLAVFDEQIGISEKAVKLTPPNEILRYVFIVTCYNLARGFPGTSL